MTWIGRKLSAFSFVTPFITPALFFYYLSSGKKNVFVIIGLISSFLAYPLILMNGGSRWAPVNALLYFSYMFLWLRNIIPAKIKKTVILVFSGGAALLILIFTVITFGRFGGPEFSVGQWLLSYSGQSFIVYNQDIWWITGYTYGEICFNPWLHPDGIVLSGHQIESITGMSVYGAFWTAFGSLQIDYGPVGLIFITISIFIIYSFIAKIKNNTISLGDLIIVSFLGYMLVTGMFFFSWLLSLQVLPYTIGMILLFKIKSINDFIKTKYCKKKLIDTEVN